MVVRFVMGHSKKAAEEQDARLEEEKYGEILRINVEVGGGRVLELLI